MRSSVRILGALVIGIVVCFTSAIGIAIGLALAALVIIFYIATIAKFGPSILDRAM